ncbi:MAG TPA: hypothetical protein VMX97_00275 [Hyphomicrobiaceae bacterium]|nr:hypothetical protein [Hyphomicrobiaceae bacterium]
MASEVSLKVRCSEEFRRRFRAATAERGLSVQDVLFTLAQHWLDGDKESVQVEDGGEYGDRRIHDKLEIILTKAEPRVADHIRGSVEVFHERLLLKQSSQAHDYGRGSPEPAHDAKSNR